MRGLRRRVRGHTKLALLMAALVVAIVLVSTGVALANVWTDITDAQWQSQYGITAQQAQSVAGGYQDGSFHPKEAVKRGQFAKMVVDGFDVAYYTPAVATFTDVLKSNTFFKYIEGGYKAGILGGYPDRTYKPNNTIVRQQANNILGSYLSKKELSQKGTITGSKGTYGSLGAWYSAEGALILAAFKDAAKVSAVHAPGTAYLVYHQVVKGSNGNLTPGSTLTRAQAVALIIRVGQVTFTGGGGTLPTVTALSPAAGVVTGGNGVVITGTNFTNVSAVKFGNSSANFAVNSATQITATAPAGSAGTTVDVTVTNAAGTSIATTLGSKYSYGPPVVTKLEPTGGSPNGNTAVKIIGTGFTGVTYVRFGNLAAKSFVVISPTEISAISPGGDSGTSVDVVVNTPAGTSAVSANSKFTYGIPTITKLEPAAGPTAGGNTVVITGTGFSEVTVVKFGTTNATSYTINSSTQITAVAPAQGAMAQTVDVTVTNPTGTSGASATTKYSYGIPTVTKLEPAGGPEAGGTSVGITGTGFTGVTSVKFGQVSATFVVTSPTFITATAPKGTAGTTVDVTVTTPAGTSVTTGTANDYAYGVPTITGLNPAAGITTGGNNVVITGTNFSGVTAVKFGTTNATSFTVNSATQITAVAPAGTVGQTVEVTVTNGAGTSAAGTNTKYSYGIPAVTALSPYAGINGTSVVIIGTGFTGVTSVKFGMADATSYTVNSPTQITAVAPAFPVGITVDVTVTTPAGTSTPSDSTASASDNSKFQYISPPTVTGLNPTSGSTAGGNSVVITGTNFINVTAVKFGSAGATSYTVNSETQITAVAPAQGSMGQTVNVTVTTPAGTSPTAGTADDYTYGMPKITGLIPPAGNNGGGNSVTIVGSGFVNVSKVEFVTLAGASVEATVTGVNSDKTQLTVIAPSGLDNKTVDVRVINPVGTSVSSDASKYAYGAPSITGISPKGGAGGTIVTIEGHGFTGLASGMTVTFTGTAGGSTTAAITEIDTTAYAYIKVTAPAQGAMTNPVTITVATAAGSDTAAFNYGIPSITSITPAAGPSNGGNNVIITGTNLAGVDVVTFGGMNGTIVGTPTSTQITVRTPNLSPAETQTVAVVVKDGSLESSNAEDDLRNKYTFGEPTITSINPTSGPAGGGTTVTITGTGFTGVTGVSFGGSPATIIGSYKTTEIKVTAPSKTGVQDVTVSTPAGTSNAKSYAYGIPAVTGVSPVSGPTAGGTSVTISGSGFSGASVTFGGVPATNVNINIAGTSITCTTPANGEGTKPVVVSNDSGPSDVTDKSQFTYGPPVVSELSPSGGAPAGGNLVTIKGDRFAGVTSVKFGATSVTFTVVDLQTITATAPAGAAGTTVQVTVTTYVGATSATSDKSKYSYGVPTVTSLSPAAGPNGGGTSVLITGTNFSSSGVTAVKFGNTTASWVFISSTQIAATSPSLSNQTVDVTVENGAGKSAASAASKYTFGRPTISSLSPNTGPATGNTTVVITGTGFTGVTSVKFGDAAATIVGSYTPTQITVKSPAGTFGNTVEVTVTTFSPDGTSLDPGDANNFYYGAPTVTGFDKAAADAGQTVKIYGTNFMSGTTNLVTGIKFGNALVLEYTVNSATQITVKVPARAGGDPQTVDVIVTTTAGPSANTQKDDFSYGRPVVISVTPDTGPKAGGNLVYITGTGFSGDITVSFGLGRTASIVSFTPTLITVRAPSNYVNTSVKVIVTTDYDSSADDVYYNYE